MHEYSFISVSFICYGAKEKQMLKSVFRVLTLTSNKGQPLIYLWMLQERTIPSSGQECTGTLSAAGACVTQKCMLA